MSNNPWNKICSGPDEALRDISDGAVIMSGGFGLCGIPENSIEELRRKKIGNLSVISNNIGNSGRGLAVLLQNRQITKAYCSFVGGNPDLEAQMLSGEVEVELIPQGTFAERIRAAGMGIRAFYTPTGAGTVLESKREVRQFDKPCLLEYALEADFAIIKAQCADSYGNLKFRETARNFSPLMAMAGKCTIVEVEELYLDSYLDPDEVHLPGIFVQRIYQGTNYHNDIEFLKVKDEGHGRD